MGGRLVFVSRVGRKGVIALPKAAREFAGISDGSVVVVEAYEDRVVLRPLRVVRVRASGEARRVLEEALGEELVLEERKAERLVER